MGNEHAGYDLSSGMPASTSRQIDDLHVAVEALGPQPVKASDRWFTDTAREISQAFEPVSQEGVGSRRGLTDQEVAAKLDRIEERLVQENGAIRRDDLDQMLNRLRKERDYYFNSEADPKILDEIKQSSSILDLYFLLNRMSVGWHVCERVQNAYREEVSVRALALLFEEFKQGLSQTKLDNDKVTLDRIHVMLKKYGIDFNDGKLTIGDDSMLISLLGKENLGRRVVELALSSVFDLISSRTVLTDKYVANPTELSDPRVTFTPLLMNSENN